MPLQGYRKKRTKRGGKIQSLPRRMVELAQTANALSLRLKASPGLTEQVKLLAEMKELSWSLKSAYDEAARTSV